MSLVTEGLFIGKLLRDHCLSDYQIAFEPFERAQRIMHALQHLIQGDNKMILGDIYIDERHSTKKGYYAVMVKNTVPITKLKALHVAAVVCFRFDDRKYETTAIAYK